MSYDGREELDEWKEKAEKLAKGLLSIAKIAMPDTYFTTDPRCMNARRVLIDLQIENGRRSHTSVHTWKNRCRYVVLNLSGRATTIDKLSMTRKVAWRQDEFRSDIDPCRLVINHEGEHVLGTMSAEGRESELWQSTT